MNGSEQTVVDLAVSLLKRQDAELHELRRALSSSHEQLAKLSAQLEERRARDEGASVVDAEMPRESTQLDILMDLLRIEIDHAESRWPRYHSHHEAYAVLQEEVDEFWDIVRLKRELRDPGKTRDELLQVACVAIRSIMSLLGEAGAR